MKVIFKTFIGVSLVLVLAGCGDISLKSLIAQKVGAGGGSSTIRVGSVADARVGTTWTLDGSSMVDTRAKLLNTANFGPGGIVAKSITITDVSTTIDATVLSNFDVFFIGWIPSSPAPVLSGAELAAMAAWVNSGGVMIVTANDVNHDGLAAYLGYPPTASGVSPTTPTAAGLSSPLFTSPLSPVNSLVMGGVIGYFGNPTGTTILGADPSGRATVLQLSYGAGKMVLLSNIEIVTHLSGGLSVGSGISNDSDRFLVNLFAYAHK